MKQEDDYKIKINGKLIFLGLILVIGLMVLSASVSIIDAGERGVVVSRATGVKDEVLGEGFHFVNPLLDSVKKINVQTNNVDVKTSSTSQDQQIVMATVSVNFKIDSVNANKLYQDIGNGFVSKVLKPAIESSIKTAMADFKAEQLITERDLVSNKIMETLKSKLQDKYLIIERINIVNLDFSDSFNKAIEDKVVAEQQELKARNDLERIKIEAEQEVVQAEAQAKAKLLQAEAEAESIKLQNEALKESEDILQLRWIEKWDGVLPKVTGNNDNLLMLELEE